MARSKFPGKPSKPVNRTRISVLPPTTDEGDTIINLPKDLKQDDEAIPNASFQNREGVVKSSNTRRTIKRKRVCKRLIVRIPNLSSQKFKNGNKETPRSKKKTDRRSDKEVSAGRKVVKVKQTHLEGNNVVGKFVLPSRSVHSSRVIKPNKRFINVDAVSNVRTFKKRVVSKKTVIKVEGDDDCINSSAVQTEENVTQVEETSIIRTPCSSRRVILRQARLQLHTQASIGSEGPFSSSNSSNSSETVTCGVCGAVRFYRFVKQARKFNIYSCESCRKFISKMIKRQMCSKKFVEIQCLKGQGTCHVPPIVRSQHWKFRCSYKARCNACWLKMCLKAFQMPATLKSNLTNFLPKFMRESETLFNNSLSLFSFHTNPSNSAIITPSHSVSPNSHPPIKRRPIRKRVVKPNLPPISNIKRQKIDLKGPRVKHVCRSASIVLGQPLATFSEESKLECEIIDTKKPVDSTPEVAFEIDASDNKENNIPDNKTLDSKNILQEVESRNSSKIDIASKRDKTVKQFSATVEAKSRRKREENYISTDFWENYDPEEVCRTGFGLISSVSFPMAAICFLCGSSGQDPLLFCCLCCEPYHTFCLEQIPQNINVYDKCYDWVCPKCTVCSACGETDKQKFKCQKCNKAYHLECFNTKWQSDDRPTVCTSCLHCKSCGKDDIAKFIGNTPLCAMCFRLRKKGNFCPLCQGCYDDNDFDTKMMECGKCNKWVHAKCEGLSEEQYQILSLLPDSMEFLCNICESSPAWKKAVVSELKSSCNMVLRLLSKNRVARSILKLSPICLSPRSNKSISSARKLQFSDESEASDSSENENEEDSFNKKAKHKHNLKEIRVNLKPCNAEEAFVPEEQRVLSKVGSTLTLSDIKNKVNSNDYFSLRDFDDNMKETLKFAKSQELLEIYQAIIKQVFSWYNCDQNNGDSLNTSFCDVTKLEDVKSPLDCCKHKIVNNVENENRMCSLCKGMGDGLCFEEARLLYCGNNEWVHANCALWSSEVYEEIDGALQNVQSAIIRGRSMRCSYCKLKGASIGCCAKSCHETYHFSCSQAVKCYFMHDKSIYCPSHSVINNVSVISSPSDFAIHRSIYVELDKKKKRYVEPKQIQFMLGSLCITNLGTIVPALSDQGDAIIPLDLSCRRLFWSTTEPWKLVSYIITTHVLKAHSNNLPLDKNFTIDHTVPKIFLDKKLKEILLWQREIEKSFNGSLDSEDEEEPQIENAADILSPELTDAILEELPHDLLDGISMQDIFPKLMNNEELLGVDFKIPDTGNTDLFNSKSENFQHPYSNNKISKIQNNQRSCSVKLSCKVDNSAKQMKNMPSDKSLFFQLLQVDGAYDNSSSSDCESIQEVDDLWIPEISDEPVQCERCQCTYRTKASYKRHLDSCEVISTSESDSETMQEQELPEPQYIQSTSMDTSPMMGTQNITEPYVVSSYESYSSYQATQNAVHSSSLNTHTFVNSEPIQTVPQNSELCFSSFQPVDSKSLPTIFTSSQTPTFTINQPSNTSQITIGTPQMLSSAMPNELCMNQGQSLYISQPTCNTGGISIVQPSSIPISINQMNSTPIHMDIQPQQLTLQPLTQEVSPLLNQITLNAKMVTNQSMVNSMVVPHNQFLKQIPKPTVISHKNIRARGRPKQIAMKRNVPIGNKTFYIPPSTVGGPSVMVQQLPSTNMIPSFLESFQHQTGQNLQYITTITPQITPTVTNQGPIMQLQPDGTLVNLVSGVQPTVILPQQRMLGDSILVDNNGSLVWAPQQVQPIYYGFETIVQNTVLQSQQILPGTVPGVLTANSSYSSTTQVFQTSKLEPMLDVASGNIVLLNSSPVVNSQPLPVPQAMSNPLPTPPLVISESKPTLSWNYIEPTPSPSMESHQKPVIISPAPPSTSCNNTTSINLPIAPFIPEPGIPTNVVPPTPKPPMTAAFNSRPMNRVLPMPTINSKQVMKSLSKTTPVEKPLLAKKVIHPPEKLIKPKIKILEEIVVKPAIQPTVTVKHKPIEETILKQEQNPLKLVFQKQNECGVYKISNTAKNVSPIQVVSLKPIKVKSLVEPVTVTNEKPNGQERKSSNKNESAIIYTIETQDGFHYSSNSIEDLWTKVFEAVQAARLAHNMPPLPSGSLSIMNKLQALGLKSNGLKYLLEQLPGAGKCVKYKPSFHFQTPDTDVDEDSELIHHRGALRCAPHINSHEPSDMFSWLSSKHRKPPRRTLSDTEQLTRRGSVTSLPMAMRFRHLKLTSKQSVGVYRSRIHKRGLFCHRDIETGEMVIEYAGEVIRSILADKREKHYTVKGMGCYMFRIDENFVVDATMKGNAARFINHSCEPNCYSKVVEILGHKHIIIFALRKIQCAEELTYDYKFPFEEDKIPCTCGSRRCRKFLN